MTGKQIIIFVQICLFSSCNHQSEQIRIQDIISDSLKHKVKETISNSNVVHALDANVQCMNQDINGNYWFASNGGGVYRFDGKRLEHFTEKDGLASNFVLNIQCDINGDVWFGGGNRICRFKSPAALKNGGSFIDYSDSVRNLPVSALKYKNDALYFAHKTGIYQYDPKDQSFSNFKIQPDSYDPEKLKTENLYGLYCYYDDHAGNLWFGTFNEGVCNFNLAAGTFKWFTEKGLKNVAMRTIFRDRNGNLWFGNNGNGLIRFEGQTLSNFTELKGLTNRSFFETGNISDNPGTMARVFSINQDNSGDLWIATIDAGLWRFDGNNFLNYTVKDGLPANLIWSVFKDSAGELWVVAGGGHICKFNGRSFYTMNFSS